VKLIVLKSQIPISDFELKEHVHEGLEVYVGRSEDCHVRLNDPLVSRHLLVLTYRGGGWKLQKLSQVSPVLINNREVDEVNLNGGDQISFGPYTLIYNGPSVHQTPSIHHPMESTVHIPETLIKMNVTSNPVEELNATEVIKPQTTSHQPEADDFSQNFSLEEAPTSEPAAENMEEAPMESSEEVPNDFNSSFDDSVDALGQSSSTENNFQENTQNSPVEENANFESSVTPIEEQGNAVVESGDSTRIFKSFAKHELVIFGEYAPYDRYLVEQGELFIGRDSKKCQIVLNDPEVSSVHAVLKKSGGATTLEDLRSANGTLLGGQRINKVDLKPGDEFVIGSTSFTLKVSSDILEQEKSRLMPVDLNQVIEKEEIIEEEVDLDPVGAGFSTPATEEEKSLLKRMWKDPVKRKRLIMYGGVGLLVLMLLPSEETPPAPKVAETKVEAPKTSGDANAPKPEDKNVKKLSEEEIRNLEAKYRYAETLVAEGKLDDALAELEQIMAVDDTFGNVKTLYAHIKQKNENLKKEEEERLELARREKIKAEVKVIEADAEQAVKDRNFKLARELMSQIAQKDPENIKVRTLEIEIQGYEEEENRKKTEEDKAVSNRKRMVDALNAGKRAYLKKEWHLAISELEKFLMLKEMDEDLIKEASDMLAESKNNLGTDVAPILGKARSLNEGQDLKAAFEAYQEVLRIDPTNAEAIAESDQIKEALDIRAKKSYREAIIYESLSLFTDAKEKFLEVQQNSPLDSEYYKKSSDKLKNYLE
jgi:pSer/pThr/pTyr-binding forkhead associated (FHA) protein